MTVSVPTSPLTTDQLLRLASFDRSVGDDLDTAMTTVVNGGLSFFNVRDYGILGDGASDDSARIRTLMATAGSAGGGTLYFPPGTYVVSRSGASNETLDVPADNITFLGERGLSIIQHVANMPNASVSMLRVNQRKHTSFVNMVFDGNWGNAVTRIADASNRVTLPQATINVDATGDLQSGVFPTSGTFYVLNSANVVQTITYTGKTATSFTGCSGGTGTLVRGAKLGLFDDNDGHNHVTQIDPKNYGVMLRGAEDVLIANCLFRQTYGDYIWIGGSTTGPDTFSGSRNVRILNCDGNVGARNGVTFGSKCEGITIRDCRWTNVYTASLDAEPGGVHKPVRNVLADNCYLGLWWSQSKSGNITVSIVGADATAATQGNATRGFKLKNCTIEGGVQIFSAIDVHVDNCRVTLDSGHDSYAMIYVDHYCDDIWITDNYIYDYGRPSGDALVYADATFTVANATEIFTIATHGLLTGDGPFRVSNSGGVLPTGLAADVDYWVIKIGASTFYLAPSLAAAIAGKFLSVSTDGTGTHTLSDTADTWRLSTSFPAHSAAITVQEVSATSGAYQPAGVHVARNRIYTRRGQAGVKVAGVGVPTTITGDTGTATGVTATTLTDSGKSWTVNIFAGVPVKMGAAHATVQSNTATALTFDVWTTPQGDSVPTPALGPYVLQIATGVVVVDDNFIDCGDDGNTPGGVGVDVNATNGGGRVVVTRNKVRNATASGVKVTFGSAAAAFKELVVSDNHAWDEQTVASCTETVLFSGPPQYNHLSMNGNIAGAGVAAAVVGLTTGWWRTGGGVTSKWEGYGSPEGVVTDGIGATAVRRDGSTSTTLYVKTSGTGSTGWTAK